MDLLLIKSLSKSFAATHRTAPPAVDGMSLAVAEGNFCALVGESGSGKTTLLRMVAGLEMPDAGEISIAGKLVFGHGRAVPTERRGIGLVFQSHALFPHLTVAKNVSFGLRKMSKKERRTRVAELLSLAGMQSYGGRYPHEISGGQRQRIALVRALAPRPPLVLLDEPFSNLDVSLRSRMRDEVRSMLERERATVLFVTHDVEDALAMADQIAVMKDGRLMQEGTAREIYRAPATHEVAEFFGPCNIVPRKWLVDPLPHEAVTYLRKDEDCLWLRPECLRVTRPGDDQGSGAILARGTVRSSRFVGATLLVRVDVSGCGECEVAALAPEDMQLSSDDEVELRLSVGS